ncbi:MULTISPECIES: sulfatase [Arthrobacter]|uniref:Sulfatase n=1 Tax=Arthrobacter psychrochitiniphilus TaxID=291045 RepID=A0A2V3DPP4_9MICC|nr:sulfatase [Arthrobacter psychrochitiniphilus]NYG18253.1 arylsulfatase A-like enzyme [Arthrobacter psychrochitiniphilus]PXA64952.1 sulfatase [Arthrobacter psychrochitiniphilus]
MKAIVILFDTLNRKFLPPYGNDWVKAPNFDRLAGRTATFDNCYGGSMPCMPARRELHTGRHNFLHRGWGPLEPFDDSVPEMLKQAGVYTHLATDHQHYWLDGGATYHPRFNTFELIRGQEGDEWKGQVADPDMAGVLPYSSNQALRRQDHINRGYMEEEKDHPQTGTFDAGLHFIESNHGEDNWMVQIETFDPHEPFFSYEQYKQLYPHDYDGPEFDWPDYKQVTESPQELEHLRYEYAALLSMCDASLGRVLDAMDEHDLWEDTMLIVCTDHGLLLGEHDWLGKNAPPFYDESIHTPLFIWDPRTGVRGQRRESLVQTIDLGPTLLDFFGVARTADMQGRSLQDTVSHDEPVREAGLFGIHGGHVNVTDGRYVYMRACAQPGNQPLVDYTLMPTSMRGRFSTEVMSQAELVPPLPFTKDMPVLRVPAYSYTDPHSFGTLLFDLKNDLDQQNPLQDDALELKMASLLVDLMRSNAAPPEQFVRLGLPEHGPVGSEHLLVAAQWEQVLSSRSGPVNAQEFFDGELSVNLPLRDLLASPAALAVLRMRLGALVDSPLPEEAMGMTLVEITNLAFGIIPHEALRGIDQDFQVLSRR